MGRDTVVGKAMRRNACPRRSKLRAEHSRISGNFSGCQPPRVRTPSRGSRSLHSIATATASYLSPSSRSRFPARSPKTPVVTSARVERRLRRCAARNVCRWSGVKPQAKKMRSEGLFSPAGFFTISRASIRFMRNICSGRARAQRRISYAGAVDARRNCARGERIDPGIEP